MRYDDFLKLEKAHKVRKVRNASPEEDLQAACIEWFRYAYPEYRLLLFAVPNGGSRNAKEAVNLKRSGVVAGVADLLLLVPNKYYGSLCIEMKAGRNGQQQTQKDWQKAVESFGNRYVVCRSIGDFMREIREYLRDL